MELPEGIENRTARVTVVGLGYVGIRLALRAAEAGFNVIGIDMDQERVDSLAGGISGLLEMPGPWSKRRSSFHP